MWYLPLGRNLVMLKCTWQFYQKSECKKHKQGGRKLNCVPAEKQWVGEEMPINLSSSFSEAGGRTVFPITLLVPKLY